MNDYSNLNYSVISKIFRLLRTYHIDEKTLFESANIDQQNFLSNNHQISFKYINDLLYHSSILTGDPFFGLHAGDYFELTDMGLVGYTMLNCQNFHQAFEKYLEFADLLVEGEEYVVDISNSYVKISHNFYDKEVTDPRQLIETLFASMKKIGQLLSDQDIKILKVHFKYQSPSNPMPLNRYFKAPILFNQLENALFFHPDILTMKVKQPDPELFHLLEQQCQRNLINLRSDNIYTNKVKEICFKYFGDSIPKIDQIAKKMAMSPRNLQLKLKSEKTNFKAIIDQLYQNMAYRLLKNRSLSISEVSNQMGFSSPSCFIRVFKRWTGFTPNQYRKSDNFYLSNSKL